MVYFGDVSARQPMRTEHRNRVDLADRLRDATRSLHARAERAGVMRDVLARRVSRDDYCALLANLHAIYAALETVLTAHESNPSIAPIVDHALFRRAAIEADLSALGGRHWPGKFPLVAGARVYVERLVAIDKTRLTDVIAHAYVRYLGDLNGGQILRPMVQATLHLDGEDGVRFYKFDVADPIDHALRYRAALNSLCLDDAAVEAIVAESIWAFEQHINLFEELSAR